MNPKKRNSKGQTDPIYRAQTLYPVNPVQCFDGGPGRKLGQDEQDGQDAGMEDQELPEVIGAVIS